MSRNMLRLFVLALAVVVSCGIASADQVPAGIISLDDASGGLGTVGSFDITNFTGLNILLPDFPISTPLTFSITSLTVDFLGGGSTVLNASNFTTDGNGGFTGNNDFNLVTSPITGAVLVGTFSPTAGVNDGSGVVTIDAAFSDAAGNPSVTLTDASGLLATGDVAVIYAKTAASSAVPEPGTGLLLSTGMAAVFCLFLRKRSKSLASGL